MRAGKQELLDRAILALNFGVKYGLVGRNGVGKTTLLRHLAEGIIQLPSFINVVHVEQEIPGDGAQVYSRNRILHPHIDIPLLRHLAEGIIQLPSFINVVHVEQEIPGDGTQYTHTHMYIYTHTYLCIYIYIHVFST